MVLSFGHAFAFVLRFPFAFSFALSFAFALLFGRHLSFAFHLGPSGNSSFFDSSNLFFSDQAVCVLDGCDGILRSHVIPTWSRGRSNLLHTNGNVFFTKSFGADVFSAPFLIFPIHVMIFAILSRLSTISFTKWRSSDKQTTGSRVYPLSGLSPLMSMSSEPANPSMDVRMNASYELFVECVAQFLNDDSCAWASIFWNVPEPMMHLPHGFTSGAPHFGK